MEDKKYEIRLTYRGRKESIHKILERLYDLVNEYEAELIIAPSDRKKDDIRRLSILTDCRGLDSILEGLGEIGNFKLLEIKPLWITLD